MTRKPRSHVRVLIYRTWAPGGGGPTPLYKPYRYVPPYRISIGLLRRFGLKTGNHVFHFGLESGWVLRELQECMNIFIFSLPIE